MNAQEQVEPVRSQRLMRTFQDPELAKLNKKGPESAKKLRLLDTEQILKKKKRGAAEQRVQSPKCWKRVFINDRINAASLKVPYCSKSPSAVFSHSNPVNKFILHSSRSLHFSATNRGQQITDKAKMQRVKSIVLNCASLG